MKVTLDVFRPKIIVLLEDRCVVLDHLLTCSLNQDFTPLTMSYYQRTTSLSASGESHECIPEDAIRLLAKEYDMEIGDETEEIDDEGVE